MLVNYFAAIVAVLMAVVLVHQDVSAAAPTAIPTQKPSTSKPSVKVAVPTQVIVHLHISTCSYFPSYFYIHLRRKNKIIHTIITNVYSIHPFIHVQIKLSLNLLLNPLTLHSLYLSDTETLCQDWYTIDCGRKTISKTFDGQTILQAYVRTDSEAVSKTDVSTNKSSYQSSH